jgi:hypothetical protein
MADSQHTTSTADRRETFTDVTVELNTGIDLLIAHLEKIFDAGFELGIDEGRDVMDSTIAAQWIARRLSADISMVGRDFDGRRSDEGNSEFAQAAE